MHRLAVYPGSFDPPTFGHLDIIERAARLFDHVIVAVGINSSKSGFLTPEERCEALSNITQEIPNVTIDKFDGLLVEFAHQVGANAIVRGLRAVSDFDYEFQIAMANRQLDGNVDTVLLMTKWDFSFISSSVVREIVQYGGQYEKFVPAGAAKIIQEKLNR